VGKNDVLVELVSLCAEEHFPLFVIGNRTTILFTGSGMQSIVAHLVTPTYHLEAQGADHALLIADAGVTRSFLIQELAAQRWGGLAFGVEIPGTLAGSAVRNAGVYDEEIRQQVQWLDVLDACGCYAKWARIEDTISEGGFA
jgi:UDP-N-acetylmuramate dehydrogenase